MTDYKIVEFAEHPNGIRSNVKLYEEKSSRFATQGYYDNINEAYWYVDLWNNELVLAPTVPAFEARIEQENEELYKRTAMMILGLFLSMKLIKSIRSKN